MSIGINIRAKSASGLHDTLQANSGVEKHVYDEHLYFLPKQDWLPLTFVNSSDAPDLSKQVILIDIDPYIKELFWEKIMPLLASVPSNVRQKVIHNFQEETIKRLEQFSNIRFVDLYSYELIFNGAGMLSTAYDHDHERTIGLHIDTHDVSSLQNRKHGFQLLSVNLGHASRYFLYIDLSVEELLEKLGADEDDLGKYNTIKQLTHDFLVRYPDYPVKKLTIRPSQAYIAVSQNMIHDGATNHSGDMDVNFLLGGSLQWKTT